MSISYSNIAKAVALRAMQIEGGDAAAREASYSAADISAHLDGVELPYSALKDSILSVEKEMAAMIGSSTNSTYRSALKSQSDALDSGDEIPTVDINNQSFVGNFDGLFDDDGDAERPLTEATIQEVMRIVENDGDFFVMDYYKFAIQGTRVFHTREGAYFRGCVWDYSTQAAAFDAFGNSPLPQELETLFVCKVLAVLPQENWFINEAGFYANLAQMKQADVIEGKISLLTMPQIVSNTATVEPVKQ